MKFKQILQEKYEHDSFIEKLTNKFLMDELVSNVRNEWMSGSVYYVLFNDKIIKKIKSDFKIEDPVLIGWLDKRKNTQIELKNSSLNKESGNYNTNNGFIRLVYEWDYNFANLSKTEKIKTLKDNKINLVLIHELTHSLDEFKSKGIALKNSNYASYKSDIDYLKANIEVNARFVASIAEIKDYLSAPFERYWNMFIYHTDINYHYLDKKQQKHLKNRVYKHYMAAQQENVKDSLGDYLVNILNGVLDSGNKYEYIAPKRRKDFDQMNVIKIIKDEFKSLSKGIATANNTPIMKFIHKDLIDYRMYYKTKPDKKKQLDRLLKFLNISFDDLSAIAKIISDKELYLKFINN